MAAMPDAFSPIAQQFQYAATQWFPVLLSSAKWIFSSLLVVEIVQLAITRMWALGFWFPVLMSRLLSILFFQLILVNAGDLVPRAINGFIEVGSRAGGVGIGELQPNTVAVYGLVLMNEMIQQFSGWGALLHPMAAAV